MGGGSEAADLTRHAPTKRALTFDAASPEKQAPQKRSRVSRACDQCRASREKCDGAQPVCLTCTSQKRTCSYEEQPKKRGIQPNYIRTLELTLSWVFRTFPECEMKLAASLAASDDAATRQLIAGKAGQSESLHQAWRDNIICRQIDQMLSGTTVERPKASTAEETYQSPPLSAPSERTVLQADSNVGVEGASLKDFTMEHGAQMRPQLDTYLQPYPQAAFQPLLDIDPRLRLDSIPGSHLRLPEHAWTLLEYYFAFTHAWLPMTDRQATLKQMYTYPPQGLPREDATTGEYAELWSIMALAAAQIPRQELNVDSEHLREIARSLIPSERSVYEIGHLRALVLLAVLEIHREQWTAAWILVGTTIRVVIALTSHSSTSNLFGQPAGTNAMQTTLNAPETPTTENERFKHTCLGAFVVERAVAARIAAPPHLQPEQLIANGLLLEDGLEEWSPWHDPLIAAIAGPTKTPTRSFSTLNRLVRMADRNIGLSLGDPGHPWTTPVLTTVSRLIANAAEVAGRIQPAAIVSQCDSLSHGHETAYSGMPRSDNGGEDDAPPGSRRGKGYSDAYISTHDALHQGQQLGFVSIPETAESAFSGSPTVNGNAPMSSGLWIHGDGHAAMDQASAVSGADIFEELALLEQREPSQHPQFLQNLGYPQFMQNPEIDLAEFFGADYQPSDPMLAYMQPSLFNVPSGANEPPADAG